MSRSDLEPLASDCSQGRVASRRILSKGPISGHEPVPPARVHGGLLNGRGTAEQWIREGKCLDFNLADGEVTPVLELLASKGLPMVVYTGRGLPKELTSRHPTLTVLHKPLPANRLVTEFVRAKPN
jgi:hypothetical protein